jgi:hypothetical protein
MSKLFKDVPKMIKNLQIIEQYNNFHNFGSNEDVDYLRKKVNNLYNIKDTDELVKEFMWCAKMINMYIDEIDPEFKRFFIKEERKREEENF